MLKNFLQRGSDTADEEKQDQVNSPSERWRKLALKVQQEHDPQRMIKLVEQLLAELEQQRPRKRVYSTVDAENGQMATELGANAQCRTLHSR